jgi:hypothetical protein
MQRSQVLLAKAKEKLIDKGRLVRWNDYAPEAGSLGEARPVRRCRCDALGACRPRTCCAPLSARSPATRARTAHSALPILDQRARPLAEQRRSSQGTYGTVIRVRKKNSGAEYAVKIFTGYGLGPAFTHEVLSELKALFKACPAARGHEGLAAPRQLIPSASCRAGEEGLAGV